MGRIQGPDEYLINIKLKPPTDASVMEPRKIRVLIAKIGLDGHDRGAKVVARALRDAGMEVIYTGIRQTVANVVAAAVQEDVDVLGLSFLAGDHLVLVPNVIQKLQEAGRQDLPVVIGGIVLKRHIPGLMKLGVRNVFVPGTPLEEIVNYFKKM
jgi:methylmalonyl-CoA mutase C-terminal domain/subunit